MSSQADSHADVGWWSRGGLGESLGEDSGIIQCGCLLIYPFGKIIVETPMGQSVSSLLVTLIGNDSVGHVGESTWLSLLRALIPSCRPIRSISREI